MSVPPAFLNQISTRRPFVFAGASLLLYDYLITFSLEVDYIWDAPWTLVKTLFLINRYGNLVGQTFLLLEEAGCLSHGSQKFCSTFELYNAFYSVFSGESIRLLVVIRACAILGCTRSITLFVNIIYVLYAISIIILSIYWSKTAPAVHFQYLSETGICFVPVGPNAPYLWIVTIGVDVFVLAAIYSGLYRVTRWSRDRNPSRLVCLLARDAISFYLATLFNALFFIVCWTLYPLDPRNFLATFTFPILSVVGQRCVLNLRRFRAYPHSTGDISQEVRRQMAAIAGGSDLPPDPDVSTELEELRGGRTVP